MAVKQRPNVARAAATAITWLLVAGLSLLCGATPASASALEITGESATSVSATDATLNANIETNGLFTAYEFQIDTNPLFDYTQRACPLEVPGYAACLAIEIGEPLPPGLVEPKPSNIRAGLGKQPVSVDLSRAGTTLTGGSTYYFRVLATNGPEYAQGATEEFTTPVTDSPPVRCDVPRLTGRSLRGVRRLLHAAHCTLGRVTAHRGRIGKLVVGSQNPRPGRRLPAGGAVAVSMQAHRQH